MARSTGKTEQLKSFSLLQSEHNLYNFETFLCQIITGTYRPQVSIGWGAPACTAVHPCDALHVCTQEES